MTADSGGFTPEQLRAAAEDFLDRLEIGYRDQDEREATAWVVEVVDPVLRPGGYGYRRLLGPHTDTGMFVVFTGLLLTLIGNADREPRTDQQGPSMLFIVLLITWLIALVAFLFWLRSPNVGTLRTTFGQLRIIEAKQKARCSSAELATSMSERNKLVVDSNRRYYSDMRELMAFDPKWGKGYRERMVARGLGLDGSKPPTR